jgi:hypothetical protein
LCNFKCKKKRSFPFGIALKRVFRVEVITMCEQDELEPYAIKTAYRRSWCSWGMFSERTDTTNDRSIEFSTVGPTSAGLKINRTQSLSLDRKSVE